ncbi:hypothetical protein ABW19_dt0206743 [Dactylella cylindrospora]|nr:hypothetical protein ABW19_dt0206743 [Dactylella cylindrospora]
MSGAPIEAHCIHENFEEAVKTTQNAIDEAIEPMNVWTLDITIKGPPGLFKEKVDTPHNEDGTLKEVGDCKQFDIHWVDNEKRDKWEINPGPTWTYEQDVDFFTDEACQKRLVDSDWPPADEKFSTGQRVILYYKVLEKTPDQLSGKSLLANGETAPATEIAEGSEVVEGRVTAVADGATGEGVAGVAATGEGAANPNAATGEDVTPPSTDAGDVPPEPTPSVV